MAREPGSPDSRFPLRRPAEFDEDAPAAPRRAPEARAWRPVEPRGPSRPISPPDGEAPLFGRPEPRFGGAAPPPPPPPPEPDPRFDADGEDDGGAQLPALRRRRWNWWKWLVRGVAALIVLFFVAVGWLAVTAPLSKSLQPPAPPSITLLASDGTPIARRGAVIGKPVDAARLPAHVRDAFVAIEDRRFYSHWGVDPRGVMRAMWHNATSDGTSQGGSTITQQLAKNAFLTLDRTAARKFQEVLIAFWLEAWLSKDEILSRYLSNVYFGDNAYGLRAAARHYFSTEPENLTLSQASLLAGLVKAPSRLAPTDNLAGARARQKLVLGAMVDAGMIRPAEAARVRPATLRVSRSEELPNGTYFADWVLPQARDRAGGIATEQKVTTTLDSRLQGIAERVMKGAGLGKIQAALVAMRPDGRVVAMVGGRNYGQSPFNRATQARRQPGSTFKLFVYLAALRAGMTPDSMVDDSPIEIAGWKPSNSDGRYAGRITLRRAFAKSSNVVAARLTNELGPRAVTRAARDLGISTPIGNDASIGLGTSTVSLLELTSAYAAIANGSYPVRPTGLEQAENADDWLARQLGGATRFPANQLDEMRSLLATVVEGGTGRSAALPVQAFGKTGTTQDGRDALFIGYAEDLVVGIWIGNDDNSPIPGASGGGLPARIWRDFMVRALDLKLPPPPPVDDEELVNGTTLDDVLNGIGDVLQGAPVQTEVEGPRGRDADRAPPEDEEDEGGPPPEDRFNDRPRRGGFLE